jgi:hypothetical protein
VYSRNIKAKAEKLVVDGNYVYGSFSGPFDHANILDVRRPYHYPLPRFIKNLRINEAQTFQFGTDEFFAYADLYNAKLFTLLYFNFYDKIENKRYSYWRFLIGSHLDISDTLLDSDTLYRDGKFDIAVLSRLSSYRISFRGSIHAYRGKPDVDFDIVFNHSAQKITPLVSSIPYGLNRAVYSYKAPAPASGLLRIGDRQFEITEENSLGVFTDQKGFYPYITTLDWVTGMGRDPAGRRISFNLSDNHVPNQNLYNENALWIDEILYPLPAIKMTRPNGPSGDWIVQDMEGMVDLLFKPKVMNSMHVNVIFAESDYHGPFGSFEGWFMTQTGERIPVEGLYGMGKKKRLRA